MRITKNGGNFMFNNLNRMVVSLLAAIYGVRTRTKKIALIIMFALYITIVLDVVGISYAQNLYWNPIFNFVPFSDAFKEGLTFRVIFQFTANIAMFVPLGIILPMISERFNHFSVIFIIGLLLSVGIESTQMFLPRVTAIDDVILNTAGAVIGYFIVSGLLDKKENVATNNNFSLTQEIST